MEAWVPVPGGSPGKGLCFTLREEIMKGFPEEEGFAGGRVCQMDKRKRMFQADGLNVGARPLQKKKQNSRGCENNPDVRC